MLGKGKVVRGLALALFVLPLVLADVAAAQYREFTGKIDQVTKGALVVDNRMGDKLRFDRAEETSVSGGSAERKRAAWADLERGDWVSVRWKLMDKPRKAYEVIVLPPRDE